MARKNSSMDIITVDLHPEPDTGTELATIASLVRLRGAFDVVIDFSRVDIVTSASLSKLLELRKLLTDHGRKLVLFGLASETRNIFKQAILEPVFEFADDKSAALAAIHDARRSKTKVRTPVRT